MSDAASLIASLDAQRDRLRGLGYRVRFDLTDTGEAILLDGTLSPPEVSAADAETPADTALALSATDLGKLIAGRLSPMLAFSTGRLRVEGSKGVALKLAGLLDAD